jgi:hypothetical protein
MRVGQKDASHLLLILQEIGEIWHDNVNAQHFFGWEGQSTVDDNNVISLANDAAIHADLANAAERNHLNFTHLLPTRVPPF